MVIKMYDNNGDDDVYYDDSHNDAIIMFETIPLYLQKNIIIKSKWKYIVLCLITLRQKITSNIFYTWYLYSKNIFTDFIHSEYVRSWWRIAESVFIKHPKQCIKVSVKDMNHRKFCTMHEWEPVFYLLIHCDWWRRFMGYILWMQGCIYTSQNWAIIGLNMAWSPIGVKPLFKSITTDHQ